MMRKTIVPAMHELLHDPEQRLDKIKNKIGIFDRDYCQEMRSLKHYDAIKQETYDTYRDLHSIFCDNWCKSKGYTAKNTLLVDSDSSKV